MSNASSLCPTLVSVAICFLYFTFTVCDDQTKTYEFVLVRHGESTWNAKNQFTGWYNAPLSSKGKLEAESVGRVLAKAGFKFDVAYTSVLSRAQDTLRIMLNELNQTGIPVHVTWRLNERHYGNLTGYSKANPPTQYSEEQIHMWRRAFNTIPPPIEPTNPYYDIIRNDPAFVGHLKPDEIPLSESLAQTLERFLPYWLDVIVPQLKNGKRALISAHGNTLRALIKYLENLSDEAVETITVRNGVPIIYRLDEHFRPLNKSN